MAYNINSKTNGTFPINDGGIHDSTSVKLVGRNAANYGEPIAQNFVDLMENFSRKSFADLTSPSIGQIWYDADGTGPDSTPGLKVYDGAAWTGIATGNADSIAAGGTVGSSTGYAAEVWATDGVFTNLTVEGTLTLDPTIEVGGHGSTNTDDANAIEGVHARKIHSYNILIGPGATGYNETTDTGTYLGATEVNGSLTATSVVADTLASSAANITLGNTIIPAAGATNLGATSNRMGTLFANNVNFDGSINANNGTIVNVASAGIGSVTTTEITTGAAATAGTITGNWSLSAGSRLQATFADIAERFAADKEYDYGTVVKIAGDNEITETTEESDLDVFGIIAHKPAFILNQAAGDDKTHPPVALAGRTPVKLIGSAKKGDRIVASSVPGVAKAVSKEELKTISPFAVIGRALEDKEGSEQGLVMVAIGAK